MSRGAKHPELAGAGSVVAVSPAATYVQGGCLTLRSPHHMRPGGDYPHHAGEGGDYPHHASDEIGRAHV